jgi:hypothetical protein
LPRPSRPVLVGFLFFPLFFSQLFFSPDALRCFLCVGPFRVGGVWSRSLRERPSSVVGVGLTKHCLWKFTFAGRSIGKGSEARSRLYEAVPIPWGVWGTPDKADEGPSGGTLRVVAFQAGE